MKALDRTCAVVKYVPSAKTSQEGEVSAGSRHHEPLKFEVDFRIAVSRDADGDNLTENLDLSNIARSDGPYADRDSVELSATRQLPSMLREVADALERLENNDPEVHEFDLAGTATTEH